MRLRAILVCMLVAVGCGGRDREATAPPSTTVAGETTVAPAVASTTPRPRGTPGVRMTMAALHRSGGVPAGWQLTPPPGDAAAGRQLFEDFGCGSCHKVAGEPWEGGPEGPDLTGMGAHHPPGYFAEAILNPDAVLVEGDGWIGPDGHSTMPSYPDMTLGQLADVVAYLASLTVGGEHAGHVMAGATSPDVPAPPTPADTPPAPFVPANLVERPPPPQHAATIFFAQSFEVLPGKLNAFVEWFEREGGKQFLAVPGLLAVDTYVDNLRPARGVTTIWSFRDAGALNDFLGAMDTDAHMTALGAAFDAFIGDHDHSTFARPPIYRVPALSVP